MKPFQRWFSVLLLGGLAGVVEGVVHVHGWHVWAIAAIVGALWSLLTDPDSYKKKAP